MAHHKSAIKRIKTNKKANLRNRAYRTQLKNSLRKVKDSTEASARSESLLVAVSTLDRLVSKGIIRKGTAARRKSRLHRMVTLLNTPPQA